MSQAFSGPVTTEGKIVTLSLAKINKLGYLQTQLLLLVLEHFLTVLSPPKTTL